MSRVRNGTTPGVLEALRWPNALERKIALRYRKGRRSRALSLNTVISIGGVAVGVMALIVVLGNQLPGAPQPWPAAATSEPRCRDG